MGVFLNSYKLNTEFGYEHLTKKAQKKAHE